MAQRVYATASDFYDFTGGDDPNEDPNGDPVAEPTTDKDLNALLRRASGLIDGLTRHSVYDADDDGYPTDADVTELFKDATCAQVAYWEETEDPTGAVSQEGTFSIGSVSIGARGRSSGNGAPDEQQSRVAPEAVEILTTAGLISAITAYR
ncbi:hypothetical protein GCM10022239_03410 [Leifsonia bigeumensis]|uniref:Uncharacterized protein n=1 Tax=Leifsonella bigeumensis TaxID=433643 RepID=A0ABP7F2G9_9MICO